MATMMRIEEPRAAPRGAFALWALGFRPFYLLASAFAALSVLLWALQYGGLLAVAVVRGPTWHGHEMLFGFAMAVIAGFLLTAVRNWTQRRTPEGWALAAIASLWIAGRILVLTPYVVAAAVVNAAFPLAVAVGIGIPLVRAANRRNYFFIALMIAASGATLAVHLAAMGAIPWPERLGLQVGLDLVLFVIAVVAGRVVPMFTNNGVPGAGAARKPVVETLVLASTLVLLAADLIGLPPPMLAPLVLVACVAHAWRLFLWRPWNTAGNPLVWILHAAYLWIPLHLLLRLLALAELVPAALAVHALTVGGIGGMTLGMMTRTAKGHTGRVLQADRWEVAAYALVMAAALVRVGLPLAWPAGYSASVVASGVLWSAAFGIYFVRYLPILLRPRIDGRPG
jgi:uncharacterized protein involved in response to NO